VNWVFAPVAFPYGGLAVNGDIVYQGQEVSDYVYPYAIPTSNPDIVISPFALNNLVDVTREKRYPTCIKFRFVSSPQVGSSAADR
jgi:hypothetical protein